MPQVSLSGCQVGVGIVLYNKRSGMMSTINLGTRHCEFHKRWAGAGGAYPTDAAAAGGFIVVDGSTYGAITVSYTHNMWHHKSHHPAGFLEEPQVRKGGKFNHGPSGAMTSLSSLLMRVSQSMQCWGRVLLARSDST